MKTLLLLAGRSRRFWPLREKTLFPICGKTLLEHQVERLRAGGCREIILVGGAHNLHEAKRLFPNLRTIRQANLDLGMQGALLSALPSCKKESVMIMSANDVIEPQAYRELRAAAAKADGAILAKRVERYFPGGYLTVKGNRVTSIVEKPGEGKEPSNLVNIVAHIHNDSSVLLAALRHVRSPRDDAYERALAELVRTHRFTVVRYGGFWQAVKFPWQILPLLNHLLQGLPKSQKRHSPSIHPTAVLEGNVVLSSGVKILPHASVIGPSFIGRDTVIGTGALVRQSSIGNLCVIGYNTEVKASILSHHVWTHSTYIGDSVIGENVAFGAGVVTGNFRLDEGEISSQWGGRTIPTGLQKFGAVIGEGSRIGIQVGTNPGVKIGKGSFVCGGAFVTEDVPDHSFVCSKYGAQCVRENRVQALQANKRVKFRRAAL